MVNINYIILVLALFSSTNAFCSTTAKTIEQKIYAYEYEMANTIATEQYVIKKSEKKELAIIQDQVKSKKNLTEQRIENPTSNYVKVETQQKPEMAESNVTSQFHQKNETRIVQNLNASETSTSAKPCSQIEPVNNKPEIKQGQKNKVTVYFSLGSYHLSKSEIQKLDNKVIEAGKKYSVAGYTCQLGEDIINKELAKNRAAEITKFIKEKGGEVINKSAFTNCCYETDDISKYYLNRRVEITW